MKSIIKQLEELKKGSKYYDSAIDEAIAIVSAGRDDHKRIVENLMRELEAERDEYKMFSKKWDIINALYNYLRDKILPLIDEIIGGKNQKPPNKARSRVC